MSTAKPQQPDDGRRDESEDLITELARVMAAGAQGNPTQPAETAAEAPAAPAPAQAAPVNPLRIPGEENPPATPAAGFKFDFNAPKAPPVSTPEPLVNWEERLKRGSAPASPVRLEPTLERVPVEQQEQPAQSFVAPPVSETPRPPETTPEPEPAPAPVFDDGHDAIADLIAAELDNELPPPQSEPEPEPEPVKPLLRAVNYPAQPRPENDRFSSPPVFGGGAPAPATPAPSAEQPLDPMDEIESLIGAAIQNDHGSRPVAPSPSAAAGTADDDRAHEAAEAAILAAAAASGVEVSRVAAEPKFPPPASDDEMPKAAARRVAPRRNRGFRPFVGPVIAGVLLIAAGTGLYWVLGMGHGDGTAPVLTADTAPVKKAPEKPAATATKPAATSAVFDELDGKVPVAGDEQLVSRDQSTGAEVTPVAIESNGEGLANRKVRTVTVRPDGTIVNAEDALAGAEALPVDRPNVPDVPDGNLDASDLLNAAAKPQETASLALSSPSAADAAPAETPAQAPVNADMPAVDAPVPMAPPSDLASLRQQAAASTDLIGNLATQNAAPANNDTGATASSPAPAAYVQLSSQRDLNVAQQSLIGINSRWGKLLNGVLPEVQRVDLGARGIYYRVRVPANSLESANYLCGQIKSSGGDCLVTN